MMRKLRNEVREISKFDVLDLQIISHYSSSCFIICHHMSSCVHPIVWCQICRLHLLWRSAGAQAVQQSRPQAAPSCDSRSLRRSPTRSCNTLQARPPLRTQRSREHGRRRSSRKSAHSRQFLKKASDWRTLLTVTFLSTANTGIFERTPAWWSTARHAILVAAFSATFLSYSALISRLRRVRNSIPKSRTSLQMKPISHQEPLSNN